MNALQLKWGDILTPLLFVYILAFVRMEYGVLLFHTLAELFSVIVGVLMLLIVWNTSRFTRNDYFMYLSIGYFFIAILELLHTFVLKGQPSFSIPDSENTLHFWIYSRFLEALLLLTAVKLLNRTINMRLMFAVAALTCLVVIGASMSWSLPQMLTIKGLADFKVGMEIVIVFLLIIAGITYILKRELLNRSVLFYILASIILAILAEILFTLYLNFDGLPFTVGHLLKFLSFWMIFQAIVITTLRVPFSVMARTSNNHDVIPHPSIIIDNQGLISQVNKAAEKMSNKMASQLIQQPVHENFHPAGVSKDECILCIKMKTGREPDNQIVYFSESEHWYIVASAAIKFGEDIGGMVQSFTDITEAQQSRKALSDNEEQLRALFETTSIGLALCKMDGTLTKVNEAYASILGRTVDEVLELTYWEITPVKYKANEDIQLEYLQTMGRYGPFKKEYIHKDGHLVPVELRGRLLELEGEDYIWSVVENITERNETEKLLRRSQKMDAIGQMASGIAHDFNNILSIIMGNACLLEPQVSADKKSMKWLNTINKASNRAADLTKQLLRFSQQKPADLTTVNVNALINGMGELLSRSITPEVKFELHLAEQLWYTKLNKGDFGDALLNLIINSRDAMPKGGKLTLETENCRLSAAFCRQHSDITAGEYVQLIVTDTGAGISARNQQRIFEPFYTTKSQGKGTGLGLSMVFGFVKRTGGLITVHSTVGEGTIFKVYLPREKELEKSPAAKNKTKPALPKGNETILAVDDEKDLLTLVEISLKELGYKVLIARNGKEALECLHREPGIDILFSDIVMPGGISGYDLAEHVSINFPGIKVLLTSGFAKKAANHTAQQKLNITTINKPYSQSELAHRLRLVLEEKTATILDIDITKSESVHVEEAIKWDERLATGIPEIDKDHKKLFKLYERCLHIDRKINTEEELLLLMNEILAYTRYHFVREEALMKACDYPGLKNHQLVHKLVIKKAEHEFESLEQGTISIDQLINFLGRWLKDHIQDMDQDYVVYCRGKEERFKKAFDSIKLQI